MDIKPIETRYRGVLFRSRLEARWAVFFDAMGIEWEYEPQGWSSLGFCYLPDFVLRSHHGELFVEVKPTDELLMEVADKLESMIDFNATPMSDGLAILGPIPHLPKLGRSGGLITHTMVYWNKGVSSKGIAFDPCAKWWEPYLEDIGDIDPHRRDVFEFGSVAHHVHPVMSLWLQHAPYQKALSMRF